MTTWSRRSIHTKEQEKDRQHGAGEGQTPTNRRRIDNMKQEKVRQIGIGEGQIKWNRRTLDNIEQEKDRQQTVNMFLLMNLFQYQLGQETASSLVFIKSMIQMGAVSLNQTYDVILAKKREIKKDLNCAVQFSQISWIGQYKKCVQYYFKCTSVYSDTEFKRQFCQQYYFHSGIFYITKRNPFSIPHILFTNMQGRI